MNLQKKSNKLNKSIKEIRKERILNKKKQRKEKMQGYSGPFFTETVVIVGLMIALSAMIIRMFLI